MRKFTLLLALLVMVPTAVEAKHGGRGFRTPIPSTALRIGFRFLNQ